MPGLSRRRFLQTATATALGTALVGEVAAGYEAQPDHVTLQGPETAPDLIEQYRPRLVLQDVEIEPDALYSWRAVSAEYRLTWYVYFAFYPYQDAYTERASHYPDREPVYVGVTDDGDVELVVYDQYHYLAGSIVSPPVDDQDHPLLRVIPPWHPYRPTRSLGELVGIGSLHDKYTAWLDNGWAVDPESVVDPPRVTERMHWWDDEDLALLVIASLSAQWFALNQALPGDVPLPGRST